MENVTKAEAIPYQEEGIKETIESIVIALILAFVFRAFIIEAFVIPTGSMAPTLYGAHGTIACEDCGMEFAYGLRDLDDTRRSIPILASARVQCPNCNHINTNLETSDDKLNAEKGDRILVLKWPFDFGGDMMDPKRWDVTVFKDPSDGVTNFIKRLVGLPNEMLMILDGDVYIAPLDELDESTLAAVNKQRHDKYLFRSKQQPNNQRSLASLSIQIQQKLDQKFTVARKSVEAQNALWYVVYDHDHIPQNLDPNQPRWTPILGEQSGWDASNRRVTFRSTRQDADYIELRGKEIRATNAYNIRSNALPPIVWDQRVRFVLTPQDTNAIVRIQLAKRERSFSANFHMDGKVTLTESKSNSTSFDPVMASIDLPPFVVGKAVEISFENVDYRLAIHVGSEEVLASSTSRDSDAYYAPDIASLRRSDLPHFRARNKHKRLPHVPRIYAQDGNVELTHLIVHRDEFYYHNERFGGLGAAPWAPRYGWASQQSPIMLRENEFFMLGDNTSASRDSRIWDSVCAHLDARGEDYQLGTVPRDQLIGKAFFVYWPSGHRIPWLPRIGNWTWSIIPDVGRMRTIR